MNQVLYVPTFDQVLAESRRLLLWCATPEAVVRSREPEWSEVYHQEQQHEHLQQYLQQLLQQHAEQSTVAMAQVFSWLCRLRFSVTGKQVEHQTQNMQVCMHALKQVCMHALKQVCMHACTEQTGVYACIYRKTGLHVRTQTGVQACTEQTGVHVCTKTHVHIYYYKCICIYIHIYMHARNPPPPPHTHTHKCTGTHPCLLSHTGIHRELWHTGAHTHTHRLLWWDNEVILKEICDIPLMPVISISRHVYPLMHIGLKLWGFVRMLAFVCRLLC